MSARRAGRTSVGLHHRLPALIVVAAVLVGLLAASHAGHAFSPSARATRTSVSGPTVPPADAISSSWFCAEGTAIPGGRAQETILVANLGRTSVTATVTVQSTTQPIVTRRFSVPPAAQQRIDLTSLVTAAEPGVIVEVIGGSAVVEHQLQHGSLTTVGPCARQASTDWYFAGGNTGIGAQDTLALYNPFGDDAIVDLTFLTQQGVEAPGQGQAIDVARRSRVSVALQALIPDQDTLAVHVHARSGRLVAEQSVAFDGTNGPTGLSTSLGATGSAGSWTVPTGDAEAGAGATVALANFAGAGTRVTLHVVPDNGTALPTTHVSVPAMGVTPVPLSTIPSGGGYAVSARAGRGGAIVVQLLGTWAATTPGPGAVATLGSTVAASRWAFATGRVTASGAAQLVALNPSRHRRSVRLLVGAAGALTTVSTTSVAGDQRVVLVLPPLVGPDEPVELQADGPVVAGRLILAPSPSASVGVPTLP
jgi:Family of unknown function (DUF5719)